MYLTHKNILRIKWVNTGRTGINVKHVKIHVKLTKIMYSTNVIAIKYQLSWYGGRNMVYKIQEF